MKGIAALIGLSIAAGMNPAMADQSRTPMATSGPPGKLIAPGSPWELAAAKHDIDPLDLYAIALQESRLHRPDGRFRPWPWTLHTPSEGALYFDSYESAAAKLRVLVAKGVRNIDIGLMQVNWGWHRHRVQDPTELLRPARNIEVAAQILREHLDEYQGDLRQAFARYHSARPDRGIPYAAAVLEILKYLHTAEGLKRTLTR